MQIVACLPDVQDQGPVEFISIGIAGILIDVLVIDQESRINVH